MNPLRSRWKKDLTPLLRDRRVLNLLRDKAVILELTGKRNFYFIVINIFYERLHVKVDKYGNKATCMKKDDALCEAYEYGYNCFHVKACKAWILLHQLESDGIPRDEFLYPRNFRLPYEKERKEKS